MTSTSLDRCLYEVLELPRSASEDDILDAFDELAMRCHPDRNPGDDQALARYKQIVAAYEVLSDPQKRREYDAAHPATAAETQTSAGGKTTDSAQPRRRVSAGASFSDLFGAAAALPRKKKPRRDEPQPSDERAAQRTPDDTAAEMADREARDLENWATELREWEHRLAERARDLDLREADLRHREQYSGTGHHSGSIPMATAVAGNSPRAAASDAGSTSAHLQQLASALAAVISSEVARATGHRDAA